jgi:hypothetical protein
MNTEEKAVAVVKRIISNPEGVMGQMLPNIQRVMGSKTCCFHSGFSISVRTTQEIALIRSDMLRYYKAKKSL